MTQMSTFEQIRSEARQISIGSGIATAVAAVPFVIGWVVGILAAGVALLFAAGRVGFGHGRHAVDRRLPGE